MKITSVLAAAALAASTIALGLVAPGEAAVSAGTLLPLTTVTDVVVDDAHGRVFVNDYNEGAGVPGRMVRLDLAGNLTGEPRVADVTRMTKSADGGFLVLTRSGGRIAAMDPVTGTITKTVTLPAGCEAADIAPASGLYFFVYRCAGDYFSSLGAVDLDTSVVTLELRTFGYAFTGELLSAPGAPSMLVSSSEGIQVFDTTGGADPTVTLRATGYPDGAVNDLALSEDGAEVVTAESDAPGLRVYSTDDLAHVGSRYGQYPMVSVAVRSDGVMASAAYQYLAFFSAGSFTPSRSLKYPIENRLNGNTIAFGSKRLYVVDKGGDGVRMRVESVGPPAGLEITTDRTSYTYGGKAYVAAKLTSPTTSRTVRIYRTPAGGTRTLVKSGTVDPVTGKLSAAVSNLTANTVFTAEFGGDDYYGPSVAVREVAVRATVTITTTSTSMAGAYHRVRASPAPTLTVSVRPGKPVSGCLDVTIQRYSSSAWKSVNVLKCVRRNSYGQFVTQLTGYRPGTYVRVIATLRNPTTVTGAKSAWYYMVFTS